MERLTRQNHDLEEQLRQWDAEPNSHGEEQEGISIEKRDREGPEGSNAPSRQEQQDTNRPSIAETAPLHIGLSMFDPTRERDTNPTRVFMG